MILSILIPTIDLRVEDDRFFGQLIQKLINQIKEGHYEEKVEVVVCFDFRTATIGAKRNFLLQEVKGDFLCFIDDDDDISDSYIKNIIETIESNPMIDYVGWKQIYIENGRHADKLTYHSLKYKEWESASDGWYRNVSHLNPIRSSIAKSVPYLNKNFQEDSKWAIDVASLLKSEAYIDEIMYYYRYETLITMSRPTGNKNNHKKDKAYKEVFKTYNEKFIKYHITPKIMKTQYFMTSSFNVFPTDLNFGNTLFGGKMMAEMDCEAAKVAKAVIWGTAADNVVTACFDRIDFKAPAKQGDLVMMEADLVSLGKTSMQIRVDSYIWNGPDRENWKLICTATATFVALKDGKPYPHGKGL